MTHAALAAAMLLGACSSVPMLPGLTPHKIDIQQGNVVTQDMIAKLKPGMTRSQARFVLGSPLVTDPFHSDRWDYVYQFKKAGREVERRRIVLVFESDALKRIEGDVVPASDSAAPDAPIVQLKPIPGDSRDAAARGGAAAAPDAPKGEPGKTGTSTDGEDKKDERGFFGRMLEKIGL